jgi:hypothetical protein
MPSESGVECAVAAFRAKGENDAAKKSRTNVRMVPNDFKGEVRRNAEPTLSSSFLHNLISY